jgi:hypothetical protein
MPIQRPVRVLHVISCLSLGGASRALIAAGKHGGTGVRHEVLSLLPPDRRAVALAAAAGMTVQTPRQGAAIPDALAAADIVQVHAWNTPELCELMAQPLPPMRVVVWFATNGLHPPHVITRHLAELADVVVAASPFTLRLPALASRNPESVALIYHGADFDRLAGLTPAPHDTFNVGYIGTVDFSKMHPRFVAMSAATGIPAARAATPHALGADQV